MTEFLGSNLSSLHNFPVNDPTHNLKNIKPHPSAQQKKQKQKQDKPETESAKKVPATHMADLFYDECISKGINLIYWRSCYYKYESGKYVALTDRKTMRITIARFLKNHELSRLSATSSMITSVEEFFSSTVMIGDSVEENSFFKGPMKGVKGEFLSVKNGIINLREITENPDKECFSLLAHSPDFFTFTSLPYNYEPSAKSEILFKYLESSVPCREMQKFLQQWAGINLTRKSIEHMVVLQGEGANGKSIYGGILQLLLGESNYSAVHPEDFSKDDKVLALQGMRANICDDMNENQAIKYGTIKAIVSGSPITVSRKYMSSITFSPFAKQTWICNRFPNITDRSEGVMRRFIPVIFEKTIAEHEQRKELKEKNFWIESGELPGILNWAIEGLRSYIKNGLSIPESSRKIKEEVRYDSQPELQFFDEAIEFGTGDDYIVGTTQLFEAYLKWNKGSKATLKQTSLIRALKKRFTDLECSDNPTTNKAWYGRQRFIKGIRIAAEKTMFAQKSFNNQNTDFSTELKTAEAIDKAKEAEQIATSTSKKIRTIEENIVFLDQITSRLIKQLEDNNIPIDKAQLLME